jgi:hypothetical protein
VLKVLRGLGKNMVKVKVKVTQEQATKAQRWSRDITLLSALDWVRGQLHAPAALPPGKDPVPIVEEYGCAPRPVWTGTENLASTGI